jgi:hypothetical protein
MTLIKTFEEFNKPAVIDEARTVGNVSVANPEKTLLDPEKLELKRWNVVIRSGEEGNVDVKNPSDTLLNTLAKDSDFKKWWLGSDLTIEGVSYPNTALLAIIDLGVQNKTNLIGQKVFKAQIAFLPYIKMFSGGDGLVTVNYDVTKVPHSASTQVENSTDMLVAWNKTDLPQLIAYTKDKDGKMEKGILAINKETGGPIKTQPENLVTPAYVEKNGAPGGIYKAAANAAVAANDVTTTTTTAAPGTAVVVATTIKAGLKSNNVFSQDVKDLQNKILANGGDAAAKIKAVGGADGKYGNATATAIGILTGTPAVPVIDITQDIADKLNTILKDVKVAAPVVKPDTTKKPTGKKQASADPGF